jgi:hypothetical protein
MELTHEPSEHSLEIDPRWKEKRKVLFPHNPESTVGAAFEQPGPLDLRPKESQRSIKTAFKKLQHVWGPRLNPLLASLWFTSLVGFGMSLSPQYQYALCAPEHRNTCAHGLPGFSARCVILSTTDMCLVPWLEAYAVGTTNLFIPRIFCSYQPISHAAPPHRDFSVL